MEQRQSSAGEEFFLKSMNVEKVFNFIERRDYFFLYSIKSCMEQSGSEQRAYLSELAQFMNLSVPEISKAVKGLEEKGFVSWKTDEKKERTYVMFTAKAAELMQDQKKRIAESYDKIVNTIDRKDLEITLATLGKIRGLISTEGQKHTENE